MPEMPPSAKATLTSLPYRLLARRIILPWILQGVQPSGEGLEIGAGVGAMSAQLLTVFPKFRMVATDYDTELVGMAEQVLAGFGRRASVQRADAAQLPFPDGRFDLVLSAAMLHHVIEWDKALAEAVRVLRPGGMLIGYDMLNTVPIRLIHLGERDTTLLRAGSSSRPAPSRPHRPADKNSRRRYRHALQCHQTGAGSGRLGVWTV